MTDAPDTNLPPQVRAAADRANDLVAAQLANTPESKPAAPPPHPRAAPPQPAAPQPPAPSSPPQPQAAPDWEARYHAMKGRWDQQTEQNRQLTQRLTQMEHTLASMQVAPAPVNSTADIKSVTPQERSDYGDELVGIIHRVAREVANAEVQPIKAQIGQVKSTQVMSAEEQFFKDLGIAAPNYAELNQNQEFLDWLSLTDRYTGATRQQLLTNARQRLDVGRTAAFFNDFHSEASKRPRSGQTSETGAPQPPQVDLAAYAAPGRARQAAASPPPPQESVPTFTRKGIKQFYDDVAKGYFLGRETEKGKIEAEIMDAVTRGNVT